MRVYLAAPWIRRNAARMAAVILEDAGHTVPCRWWEHREVAFPPIDCEDFEELAAQADLDLDGVMQADVLVVLQLGVSEGKAVETGVAIASGVPVIVVGERSNIFQCCDSVEVVAEVDDLLMALDNMENAWRTDDDPWEDADVDQWEWGYR